MSQQLTLKQEKFIANVIKGLSGTRAAMDAYNTNKTSVASAISYENLRKPLIVEAINGKLKAHGISIEASVEVLGKALTAKKQIVKSDGEIIETEYEDLNLQLKASDRALRLLGY